MKKFFAIIMSVLMIACFMPSMAFAEGPAKGTETNPYSLDKLREMTRQEYITAQNTLGGTMYVNVGNYSYDTDGVLGNGERNDAAGQTPDHGKLNSYGENGYLDTKGEEGKKNDGANGKNIVFVGESITSSATGYKSIDDIGKKLLLAVPAYTNVTFKGITFKNVFSFDYQLYTSPWSQLGELKFENCTFDGIIVGHVAAQTLTFDKCTFNSYTNGSGESNSNPTWIRPAYGNWTPDDNEGQGSDFSSLTTINFTNNTVTSKRPVKFERVAQWKDATVNITGNTFNISGIEQDITDKKMGVYLDSYPGNGNDKETDYTKTGKITLVWDNNKIEGNTTCAICLDEYKNDLPPESTVTDANGNKIIILAREWKTDKFITIGNGTPDLSKRYDTLKEAITGITGPESTVELAGDMAGDIEIPAEKTVTIDIAGHTLSLGESKTVTVGNNGKLIIKDSAGTGKIAFDPSSYLESGYYASKTTVGDTTYWTIQKASSSYSGGSSSSSTTTTTTDTVTNKTEDKTTDTSTSTGTTTVATTTATVKAETKTATDGTKTTTATVDTTTASKIVEKAVENKSEEVVVDTASAATVTETAAGTKTEIALPEQTVKAIAKETEAAVTIKSDAAEVKLDTEAVKAVADQAGDLGTVSLVVETVAQSESKVEVDLKLVTSQGNVTDFKGGSVSVTVKLNTALAAKPVVCVYIDDNGTYHKVKGVKNANGTYTFETGHFSTYAVMEEEEADKVIAEQTEKVEKLVGDLSLKARSAKTAKGNIKVTLTVDEDAIKAIEDLGYTVKYKFYRSTKKAASYKAKIEGTGKTYTNTAGTKGTKYYYKARVMVYDAQGALVAKSELKQCKYACRTR